MFDVEGTPLPTAQVAIKASSKPKLSDRLMDRASGVYKRNAKGVAILIGILVAFLTNTDTFHLVKRLSQDSVIRSTITQSESQRIDYINIEKPERRLKSY
ncbi:MAG: hypothetical protein V7K53_26570 [Nostoc sp.]|uniref:hypothetical protein n=1 Tax=Nostoc sp. TaxID=1180 RepID=UPI002FF914E1